MPLTSESMRAARRSPVFLQPSGGSLRPSGPAWSEAWGLVSGRISGYIIKSGPASHISPLAFLLSNFYLPSLSDDYLFNKTLSQPIQKHLLSPNHHLIHTSFRFGKPARPPPVDVGFRATLPHQIRPHLHPVEYKEK